MLTRIEGPATDFFVLDEVKATLGVVGETDDDLLERIINGVISAYDGPYGLLGRCLVNQTWQLEIDGFPAGNLKLPMPPVQSVSAISYTDSSGSEVTLNVSDYSVSGLGSFDQCIIAPKTRWPSTNRASIVFVAGFGDTPPDDIYSAMISAVAQQYGWRESYVLAQGSMQANPEFDSVIERWRTRGFGA